MAGSCVGPFAEHVPQATLGPGLLRQQTHDVALLPGLDGASTSPESALLRLGKASAQFDPDAPTGPFSSEFDHTMSPGWGFDFNHHLNYEQETAFFDAVGADMLGSDVNLALESNWQIRATAQASPLGISPTRRPSPISQAQLFLDVDQLFGFESEQPQFGNYFFPPSNLDHLLTSTQLPSQIETFQDVNLDVWHPAPVKNQVRLPAGSTKQWLKSLPFANFEAFLRSQDIIFTNNETSTEQRLGTSLSGSFALRSSRNSLSLRVTGYRPTPL